MSLYWLSSLPIARKYRKHLKNIILILTEKWVLFNTKSTINHKWKKYFKCKNWLARQICFHNKVILKLQNPKYVAVFSKSSKTLKSQFQILKMTKPLFQKNSCIVSIWQKSKSNWEMKPSWHFWNMMGNSKTLPYGGLRNFHTGTIIKTFAARILSVWRVMANNGKPS